MNEEQFRAKLEEIRPAPTHSLKDYEQKVKELAAMREQKRKEAELAYNHKMTQRELGINEALDKCKKIRAEIKEHRDVYLSGLAFLEEQLREAEEERDRKCAEPMPEYPKEILK